MLCYAVHIGTHGSTMVDKQPPRGDDAMRQTRTLTVGGISEQQAVSPLPEPELWFEVLLERKRKEMAT